MGNPDGTGFTGGDGGVGDSGINNGLRSDSGAFGGGGGSGSSPNTGGGTATGGVGGESAMTLR